MSEYIKSKVIGKGHIFYEYQSLVYTVNYNFNHFLPACYTSYFGQNIIVKDKPGYFCNRIIYDSID